MTDEQTYDEWIANRRAVEPSSSLTDRVMDSVGNQNVRRKQDVRLVDRMNESQPARLAACLASSVVGGLPLVYAAYVAELLVF